MGGVLGVKVKAWPKADARAQKQLKILVVESTRMAAELLGNALRQAGNGFDVHASHGRAAEILQFISGAGAAVVLLDVNCSDGPLSGLGLLRKIRSLNPEAQVVLLLDRCERALVVEAFRSGAKGIFCRSESSEALCRCVQAVAGGQIWANAQELHYVMEALGAGVPLRVVNAKGEKLLTDREAQLVSLVAEGLTNRGIAQELGLSEHTVKNHLFRIFDKLGISSRVELILYALSQRAGGQLADPD